MNRPQERNRKHKKGDIKKEYILRQMYILGDEILEKIKIYIETKTTFDKNLKQTVLIF